MDKHTFHYQGVGDFLQSELKGSEKLHEKKTCQRSLRENNNQPNAQLGFGLFEQGYCQSR